MDVRIITNKEEWDLFVQRQPFYTFINSWDWGEFNKKTGSKIFRLGFYEGEKLDGLALIIKVEARRGTHLFCPYGPMFDIITTPNPSLVRRGMGSHPLQGGVRGGIPAADYLEKLDKILPELKKLAKEEGACFLRIHPMVHTLRDQHTPNPSQEGTQYDFNSLSAQAGSQDWNKFKVLGFRPSPIHVHAEDTWLLDLVNNSSLTLPSKGRETIENEELLANMRKTTRYMIKRAIKEGVKVEKNNSEEYIDKFIKMHRKHSDRSNGNNYTAFSEHYIKSLFEVFPDEDINLMYAEYPLFASRTRATNAGHTNNNEENFDNIEAMLVSIKYGKTTAYYLGASDIRHPKFSPAYLLQWEAIKKARDAGSEFYNFWGVSPDDNPKHPLAGVSLFKKGFGGYDYKLMHTQDLPLSAKYWLNWAVESVRRVRRGYYYKF